MLSRPPCPLRLLKSQPHLDIDRWCPNPGSLWNQGSPQNDKAWGISAFQDGLLYSYLIECSALPSGSRSSAEICCQVSQGFLNKSNHELLRFFCKLFHYFLHFIASPFLPLVFPTPWLLLLLCPYFSSSPSCRPWGHSWLILLWLSSFVVAFPSKDRYSFSRPLSEDHSRTGPLLWRVCSSCFNQYSNIL